MTNLMEVSKSLFLEYCDTVMICLSNDDQSKILAFNQAAEKLFGISTQEIIGKNIFSVFASKNIESSFCKDDLKISNTKANIFTEGTILLSDHTKRIIQQKFILSDSNENQPFLMIIMRDVTHLINDSNVIYLRNIVENLPEYIYWKDTDLIYRGCNKHVAEYLKLKSPEDIIGKTDNDFHWSEDRISALHEIDCKVMREKQTITVEDEIPNPDGTVRIMLTSKSPLICKLGKVVGVLGVSTDITEQKQIQAELKKAKEAAEESNFTKTVFMENMSHDFKTPLNGIFGALQILEMTPNLPDDVKKIIEAQKISTNRLKRMVDSILGFSKIASGKFEIQHENLNLLDIIENIVHNLSYLVKNKHVNIIIIYPLNIPRNLLSDSTAVTSILLNLMSNAVKFTHSGYISIFVKIKSQHGNHAKFEISVTDTGEGIPADKIHQIYERFHRLELSNFGQKEGHGIGLAVVNELIQKLNGKIEVVSELGKGSIFTVTLPFEMQDSSPIITNWEKQFSDLRILLINDINTSTNIFLDQLGKVSIYKTKSESSIEELKAHENNNPYHIIIIDDEIQSYEPNILVKMIQDEFKKNPKMIILSNHPQDKEWYDQARKAGFFGFIIKPLLPSEIDKKMIEFWNKWKK